MSISLTDIPAAVADYIQSNVTVEVSEVKHGISTVLQPHEKGTFDVSVTNNGDVNLTDLVYELSVSPSSVAKLISPEGLRDLRPGRHRREPHSQRQRGGQDVHPCPVQ